MIERRRIGGAAPPKTEDDPVALGREAWQRRRDGVSKEWTDWVLIGQALYIGRNEAMTQAHAKKASGKNYNIAYHHWLQLHGFDDIDKADRGKLLYLVENLAAVEAWREGLSEAERLRWNHPSSVWRGFNCPNRGNRGQQSAPQHAANTVADAGQADDKDKITTGGRLTLYLNKLAGAVNDARDLEDIDDGLVDSLREAAAALTSLANDFDQRLHGDRECEPTVETVH
jgi:hypothetical protein